jgi:uncharacterized membrane-anchored protein YhcB (DUF1043 family)
MMVGVEWLIVTALLALAAGWGLSLISGKRTGKAGARIRELENELEATRQELDDYKDQVIAQFSETARKFQSLDDSYTALHRQLAESSSLLCGVAPGPLLAAPAPREEPALAADESAPQGETAAADTEEAGETARADAPAGNPEDIVVTEPEAETADTPRATDSAGESTEDQQPATEEPRRSAAGS